MDDGRVVDVMQYMGVPFVYGGRERETGLDCWGLVRCVFADCGVELPSYTRVQADRNSEVSHTIREQQRLYTEVKDWRWLLLVKNKGRSGPPMIVTMRNGGVVANHVGVWIGGIEILHTTPAAGVSILRLDSDRKRRRIEGWFMCSH